MGRRKKQYLNASGELDPAQLTPRQLRILEYLADPADSRPRSEFSKATRISERLIYKCKREIPGFNDAVIRLYFKRLDEALPELGKIAYKMAEGGNAKMWEMLHKIAGRLADIKRYQIEAPVPLNFLPNNLNCPHCNKAIGPTTKALPEPDYEEAEFREIPVPDKPNFDEEFES